MTNDKAADLFKAMAQTAGFTDEQVAKAMAAPQWKEIENRDNRHSEYASALDKAKNLEPLAAKAKEWDKWWTEKGGSTLYTTQQEQATQLALYQERFGNLNPNDPQQVRQVAAGAGITMQQAQEMLKSALNEQGVRFSQMSNELLAVTVDAQNRGIKLTTEDIGAMNKLMADKGVTYAGAYQEHLGPRVREMEEQKRKKELEDYATQKVQDELTRRGISGVQPGSSEVPASFFERPATGMADKPKSDQELMAMWNDAGHQVASRGRAA